MTPTTPVYIGARQVRARYGNVSDMWLWRKLHDAASGFPQPIYFGRTRMWRLSDLEAWEIANASRTAA